MVRGIHAFLDKQIQSTTQSRQERWKANWSAEELTLQRQRLAFLLGAADPRLPLGALRYQATTSTPARIYHNERTSIYAVSWPVLDGVNGEGLLLHPKGQVLARVVVLPDADQTPEQLAGLDPDFPASMAFARRLAESGCQVVIPTLINRESYASGSEQAGIQTNQPHREWIYRMAFEMGRHLQGYEIQKVLSVIDWMEVESKPLGDKAPAIGIAGYGEGGLLALRTAALDAGARLRAAWISGAFQPQESLWEQPIDRNVFGLLKDFGDAELVRLAHPCHITIEYSEGPVFDGPRPPDRGVRGGAAPGRLGTPPFRSVEPEFERARDLVKDLPGPAPILFHGNEGLPLQPGSTRSLEAFLQQLRPTADLATAGVATPSPHHPDPIQRQVRQVRELENHVQAQLRRGDTTRSERFWSLLEIQPGIDWERQIEPFRQQFRLEVIGDFGPPNLPPQARSRVFAQTSQWTGHEVVLDVWEDVFAWGYLLLPNDLKEGEKRPVVVCQHGLEGLPEHVIERDRTTRSWKAYKAFASELADRGFIVFAPHNPYRGGDLFRSLQRKLNPMGKTLFSVILGQHERILEWLASQSWADPQRIGFYGLSYGGKTAMRIPALIPGYALSICSADFNDWIRKNATTEARYSYLFTGEYEIFEFNLGQTFNYAEMAALIAPRPFMVERGHDDGVAPDEWVAYEYAKIRRFYTKLGIGDRTEIEFFNGPHTINGQGTYRFLHQHLKWPEPGVRP